MSTRRLDIRSEAGSWLPVGLMMGVVAGIVFIIFETVTAGITGPSPAMPLRMISAIVLGAGALQPSINVAAAAVVGLIVHFILSAIFGLIFGVVVWIVGPLTRSRGTLIAAATVYGFLLWIINFYVVAPQAFPWFAEANPVVQFVAHTFFFGAPLGLLLATRSSSSGRRL